MTTSTTDRNLTDLIESGLNAPFFKLRLPGVLEKNFNNEQFMLRFLHVIRSGWLALLIFNAFLVVDWLLVPDIFLQAVFIRLIVFTPLCLLILLFGQRCIIRMINKGMAMPRINDWVSMLSGWGASVSLAIIVLISSSPSAILYTAGFSVIILYGNLVQKLSFWFAVVFTLGVLLISQIMAIEKSSYHENIVIGIFLLLFVTSIITLISNYVTLKNKKRNFLLGLQEKNLIEDLNHANQRLEKVSRSDALTGLFNRRHFKEYLDLTWQRASMSKKTVTLLMIDVDHFKPFNDNYGHQAGDACLKKVAIAITDYLRAPGDLVARYGGEEFVAVLHPTSHDEAVDIANRVRCCIEALQLQHAHSPVAAVVTVSIGVGVYEQSEASESGPNQLIALADKALYAAKYAGRNRVHLLTGSDSVAI